MSMLGVTTTTTLTIPLGVLAVAEDLRAAGPVKVKWPHRVTVSWPRPEQ